MAEDWRTQSERATPLMLNIIVFLGAHVPRLFVRPILYVIVAYFLLTSPKSRRASADYLKRALGRVPRLRDHWRHFFAFASCTLDRIFLLSKNHGQITVDATWTPDIAPIVASGRGCLTVVAHFGSAEVLRFTPALLRDERGKPSSGYRGALLSIKTTILMDRQHGRMLMQLLERLNPDMALDVVDAAERGPQLVLKLKEALEAGRMVCVMADRVAEHEGCVVVDFLGSPARFATGPWILAHALRAPVVLGFGIYHGGNRYSCHYELFAEQIALPRHEREQALADIAHRYARRLEHYARLAPYNWFNFYDYWLRDERPMR